MEAKRWQQIEDVCHAALAREPGTRAALLAEVCAGDSELSREVTTLLAGLQAAEGFLEVPPQAARAAGPGPPRDSLIGRTLGDYRVEALLGAGGMGEVHRARDLKLEREVAIKILPPDLAADPDRLARFANEARLLAGLNHPNIITIHDVGEDAGTPFAVTELLEGETLREVIGHRAPTSAQILAFALQAAEGLAAAHRQGIVHRDLKPENLFLTNEGRLKILDFGLATHVSTGHGDGPASQPSTLSHPGLLVGTVAYMSPEQVLARPVDPRSDIFALGVVLWELLAGQHPFRRDTLGATLDAILHEMPADPAHADHAISPAVGAIVRRCLQKAPQDRYSDADDLVRALEAAVHGGRGHLSLEGVEERSPYPGLRSFTEQDADVFFGREQEVAALWARIEAHRMLAVIGASGAGKTSFLRAGVLARRPEAWAGILCTPATSPMRALGQALTPELTGDVDALRQLVSFDDPGAALGLLRRWRDAHGEALVVVDQFEELFTLNPALVQAEFAGFLGRLATEAGVHVVLSMRDDFLLNCCEHRALAPVLTHLTALLPLGRDALRQALVEPAATLGYRFQDEALVDEMVACVEGTRAALPLLAFAVARLWDHRDRHRRLLPRAGYDAIGGVAGALAQHAESTLDRIGPERHDAVREIFRNLVTAQGTRAVMERSELVSVGPDRGVAREVLGTLVDARLLTSYEVEGVGGSPRTHRIEIAHESLLTAWPRLVRWRAQDEEGALLRDQLRQAAHLWDEKGRTPDLLWTGTAFREYALWRERYAAPLTEVEGAFAAAMTTQARRSRRIRTAAVAAIIVGLSAVALAIGVSRHQAVAAAERAEASKLVALGRLELDHYPTAAVAYARASLEVSDTPEARRLALEALWRGPVARILTTPDTASCSRVAFSPDGTALACAGFSDKVVVWRDHGLPPEVHAGLPTMADTRGVAFDGRGDRLLSWVPGNPALTIWPLLAGPARSLAASAEWVRPIGAGQLAVLGPVAPGAAERVLRRWSLEDGTSTEVARWTPPAGMRLDQPGLRPVSFDPSLRWLAFGDGSDVVLRDLTRQTGERRLTRHGVRIRELGFDPAAQRLLSLDESGLFCLWSVAEGSLLRERRTVAPHRYSVPVFSPDGTSVAWMSGDGSTYLWDLDAPADAPPLVLRRTDVRDSGDEAFDRSGRWLVSAGWSNVAMWPQGAPRVLTLPGHVEGPLLDLAFSPDSGLLASCARDGAMIWPLDAAAGRRRRIALGGDYYCYGVHFAPDGKHLALNSPYLGTYLVPLDGGPPRVLIDFRGQRLAPMPLEFDLTGRTLAAAPVYTSADTDMLLHVVDLGSGADRTFPLRASGEADGYASSASFLKYQADGRLLVAGANGLRRWTPSSGAIEHVIWGSRFAAVDTDQSGRTVVALVGRLSPNRLRLFDPELLVLDAEGQLIRRIASHGTALTPTLAVDAAGRFIVTGDAHGIVRVGPVSGGEPHLLLGHYGPINRVAVSPDGRWIASASGSEIRLWPTPDLSRPPLHLLPHEDLVARLAALTNLRAVRRIPSRKPGGPSRSAPSRGGERCRPGDCPQTAWRRAARTYRDVVCTCISSMCFTRLCRAISVNPSWSP